MSKINDLVDIIEGTFPKCETFPLIEEDHEFYYITNILIGGFPIRINIYNEGAAEKVLFVQGTFSKEVSVDEVLRGVNDRGLIPYLVSVFNENTKISIQELLYKYKITDLPVKYLLKRTSLRDKDFKFMTSSIKEASQYSYRGWTDYKDTSNSGCLYFEWSFTEGKFNFYLKYSEKCDEKEANKEIEGTMDLKDYQSFDKSLFSYSSKVVIMRIIESIFSEASLKCQEK